MLRALRRGSREAGPAHQPAAYHSHFHFSRRKREKRPSSSDPSPRISEENNAFFPLLFTSSHPSAHPSPFSLFLLWLSFFFVFMSIGQHFPWGRSKNQPNTRPAHSNGKNHSSSVLWHSPHMGSTSPLQRSQAPNQAQPKQLRPGEGLELSFWR